MQEAIIGDDFTVSYGKKFVHHLFVKNYICVYSVYYSVSQVKSRIPGDIKSFFLDLSQHKFSSSWDCFSLLHILMLLWILLFAQAKKLIALAPIPA